MGDEAPDIESKGQPDAPGNHVSQTLSKKKIFVVGAGAIGCELLKNLAAMKGKAISCNRHGYDRAFQLQPATSIPRQ
jgi:glutamyl-tRNA reductase